MEGENFMANLFQTQPYYPSVDSNQQAYNNWQNSLLQSANMAQNLHPETLAGMWGGTALGAILGRNFYDYLHPKKNNGNPTPPTPEQQEQNRKNFNDFQNNLIQSQDYWQNQRGIPENQRNYRTPFGENFGRNIYNNYYNPTIPKEFTVEQMWNTPRINEGISDYNNRVNPAWDWRQNILGKYSF